MLKTITAKAQPGRAYLPRVVIWLGMMLFGITPTPTQSTRTVPNPSLASTVFLVDCGHSDSAGRRYIEQSFHRLKAEVVEHHASWCGYAVKAPRAGMPDFPRKLSAIRGVVSVTPTGLIHTLGPKSPTE